MTTGDFATDKRIAIQSFVRELTGERVGPNGPDPEIVPYLLELNAIPGCYSWASCAGHDVDHCGYLWVAFSLAPWIKPDQLGTMPGFGPVTVIHPFQDNDRKIAFEFGGGIELLVQMRAVLEFLYEVAT